MIADKKSIREYKAWKGYSHETAEKRKIGPYIIVRESVSRLKKNRIFPVYLFILFILNSPKPIKNQMYVIK